MYYRGGTAISRGDGVTPALNEADKQQAQRNIDAQVVDLLEAKAAELDKIKLPEILTSSHIMGSVYPDPVFLIQDVLPEGVSILVSAPKIGKSWAALHIGNQIVNGYRALGSKPTAQCEVLGLFLEDTPRRLNSRFHKMGATPSEGFHIATQWPTGAEGVKAIAAFKRKHPAVRFVIIDVLQRFRGQPRPGESAYAYDYREMQYIRQLYEDLGISVLILHHTRKMAGSDFIDMSSGTQGITGQADTILLLSRKRGEYTAELQITSREMGEVTYAMQFDQDVATWTIKGTTAEIQESEARQQIYDILKYAGDALTPSQVTNELAAQGIDKNRTTIQRTMQRMCDSHVIGNLGNGKYALLNHYGNPIECTSVPPIEPVHYVHSVHSKSVTQCTELTECTHIPPPCTQNAGQKIRAIKKESVQCTDMVGASELSLENDKTGRALRGRKEEDHSIPASRLLHPIAEPETKTEELELF